MSLPLAKIDMFSFANHFFSLRSQSATANNLGTITIYEEAVYYDTEEEAVDAVLDADLVQQFNTDPRCDGYFYGKDFISSVQENSWW